MFSIYLVIGAFAGLMSGLFGIGGGIVIIPALATIFAKNIIIPVSDSMQMAVGTSLATVVITSASSMIAHHKKQTVIWEQVKLMIPGLIAGSIIGAIIANFLPSRYLRIIFGIFLILVGARMVFDRFIPIPETQLTKKNMQIGSGLIGALSSILGIGGGVLLVPFLLRCRLDMLQATGTSVACGMVVSFFATICFMFTGFLAGVHLPWSTGYIFWPAFIGIAGASIIFAHLGVELAARAPKDILKQVFGIFLWVIAIDMLFFA